GRTADEGGGRLELVGRGVVAGDVRGQDGVGRIGLGDGDACRGGAQDGRDGGLVAAAVVLARDGELHALVAIDDAVAVPVAGVVDGEAVGLQVRGAGHAEVLRRRGAGGGDHGDRGGRAGRAVPARV